MTPELRAIFTTQGDVATSPQILRHISRRTMQKQLSTGELVKIWPNTYSLGPPDTMTQLRGLDLRCGEHVAACLGSAAWFYGFDTENTTDLHVLNPDGHLLRGTTGLVVHRREGVPLTTFDGRQLSAPAWTTIEVARGLRLPRALATLDAALRSGTCETGELMVASAQQSGRRGIVTVRDLVPLAGLKAESPMESEARLVMHDGGLPEPVLQYEIIDLDGLLWRVDFAWPDQRLAVEYDGFDWHSTPEHLRRDRQKRAALQELGWRVLSVVADDVRRRQVPMVRRIRGLLDDAIAA